MILILLLVKTTNSPGTVKTSRGFTRKTKNKAIVMGSTTAKGIGRALPGRTHYVLTSNPSQFESMPGIIAYSSFEDIAVDASRRGYNEVVICGGSVSTNN